MISQTIAPAVQTSGNRTELAEAVISILEHQLEGFRSIHEVTTRMHEKFAQSGSGALSEGVLQRSTQLQHIQESEKKLQALKAQWAASLEGHGMSEDVRVRALIDACQEMVRRIVELDCRMYQVASKRQRFLQAELAGVHQHRRPITAYLDTTTPSAACSVPVAGRNVHFPKA
jgi:hypothetical protein